MALDSKITKVLESNSIPKRLFKNRYSKQVDKLPWGFSVAVGRKTNVSVPIMNDLRAVFFDELDMFTDIRLNPFSPRPAKTVHFVILLCLTPDNITR